MISRTFPSRFGGLGTLTGLGTLALLWILPSFGPLSAQEKEEILSYDVVVEVMDGSSLRGAFRDPGRRAGALHVVGGTW